MNRSNMGRARMRSDAYSLFFIHPDGGSNAHEAAERLMKIKGVAEVMVTSGQYAFVVKSAGGASENLRNYIARRHGSIATLECHYSYRR